MITVKTFLLTPISGGPVSFILYLMLATINSGTLAFSQTSDPRDFFEKKVRPIFATNCHACHNPELRTAGLDLTTAEGFKQGGQSGSLISTKTPEESRLLKAVSYQELLKMPPAGRLSDQKLSNLWAWVKMGAPWPDLDLRHTTTKENSSRDQAEKVENLWGFQSVKNPTPPKVTNLRWVQTPIDRFILEKLEVKGLQPAPLADKLTLLRRATFDLTGLPPTIEEIERFISDPSSNSFEKVVDNLLSSPRYGEHWGRHWLDVARYADSTGNDEDHHYPYAWRYRDYVIDSLNQDLPYNEFVIQQIAGDLLPTSKHLGTDQKKIIATGFLALGPKAIAQQNKTKMLYDVYDEQLDVVSKAFLGLSITCARCHDHKFDPISTKDYYSLISIFASTRNFKNATSHVAKLFMKPLVPVKQYQDYVTYQNKIDSKKQSIQELLEKEQETFVRKEGKRLADYMLAAYRVNTKGENPVELSQKLNLHQSILERWVSYLRSDQPFKPHLLDWHQSKPHDLPSVANRHQQQFLLEFTEWTGQLNAWRQAMEQPGLAENSKEEKPKFLPGKNRFFFEIYLKEEQAPFVIKESDSQLLSSETRAAIAQLQKIIEQLQKASPPKPDMANAVEDGVSINQNVFVRGDPNIPGEPVSKRSPKIFDDKCAALNVSEGSGRLELAKWLTQSGHPLTGRVIVNRVWQWHFGQGLVRTPDNFGITGAKPTHPQLLDYLTTQFIAKQWSLKHLHRLIMYSRTYQLSSFQSEMVLESDSSNLLLSHFPRRRLDVEEIRDGMLAADRSLDLKMGGTLQSGIGFQPENSYKRLSLDPEAFHIRTVYLPLRRANLPPLLRLFDFGDATTSSGKRLQTNVAPQALFMLNSGFVEKRSNNLAKFLLSSPLPSDDARVKQAYLLTLSRYPKPKEVDLALGYIRGFQQRHGSTSNLLGSWESYCRILLSSNEFIYVD